MPYLESPAGHHFHVPDYLLEGYIEEQRERIAQLHLARMDADYCDHCQESPCVTCCSNCRDWSPDDYDDDYDEDDTDTDGLLPYSWSPPGGYDFHGTGPAYYGLEIEVTSDNDYDTLEYARSRLGTAHGELGWLKSDASVRGFELVTPPMSYEFAMEHFPWDMLPALRERGCRAIYTDNGIHVHVSREAFASAAHVFRWMKLFYRNPQHVTRLARRSSGEWASFTRGHRKDQYKHARKHALRDSTTAMADNPMHPLWNLLYAEDDTQSSRYAAINTTNHSTFEVRVFASTLSATKAKRALQTVAATVEYTRKARGTAAWTWSSFREWLQLHETVYPELAEHEYASYVNENSERAAALCAQRGCSSRATRTATPSPESTARTQKSKPTGYSKTC